jgi:hypothetical protein
MELINSIPTFETPLVEVSVSSSEDDVPLHSPIEAMTESLKEEAIVVTKYEEVQLQERQLTISSNNITIKLETKMLKGPPAISSTPINSSCADTC